MTGVGGPIPRVEEVLYGGGDPYRWDGTRRSAFQYEVLREAFAFHYERCPQYRRCCDALGVTPPSVSCASDILRIPLVPASVFKYLDLRSVPGDTVTMVCQSSGTRGSVSRIFRDDTTLERFVGSVRAAVEHLLPVGEDAMVFNLGPPTEEAGAVWLPYAMSLLAALFPARNYVADGVLHCSRLADDLQTLRPGARPVLVGPPTLVLTFLEAARDMGIPLNLGSRGGLVVTAGGWKRSGGWEVDPAAFRALCAGVLGLGDPSRVRDAYSMVELNTVLLDCERGSKHLPPWLAAAALDPATLAPLPPGELGVLGYWDALAASYPGFLLSDDLGVVSDAPCACGRSGPTLAFARRVALAEERGCALTGDRGIRPEGFESAAAIPTTTAGGAPR